MVSVFPLCTTHIKLLSNLIQNFLFSIELLEILSHAGHSRCATFCFRLSVLLAVGLLSQPCCLLACFRNSALVGSVLFFTFYGWLVWLLLLLSFFHHSFPSFLFVCLSPFHFAAVGWRLCLPTRGAHHFFSLFLCRRFRRRRVVVGVAVGRRPVAACLPP